MARSVAHGETATATATAIETETERAERETHRETEKDRERGVEERFGDRPGGRRQSAHGVVLARACRTYMPFDVCDRACQSNFGKCGVGSFIWGGAAAVGSSS